MAHLGWKYPAATILRGEDGADAWSRIHRNGHPATEQRKSSPRRGAPSVGIAEVREEGCGRRLCAECFEAEGPPGLDHRQSLFQLVLDRRQGFSRLRGVACRADDGCRYPLQ